MPLKREFSNIFKNIQEIDLRPLRDGSLAEINLAFVGMKGVGKKTLVEQLRSDPNRPHVRTAAPVILATLETSERVDIADAVVLIVDANKQDLSSEQSLVNHWHGIGKPLLVLYNKLDQLPENDAIIPWLETGNTKKIYGSALDRDFLNREFASALLELLPEHTLALGRRFPLLRIEAAHQLINDTCFANAIYSLGTGMAEIVPILDIPLNVADIIVLTKAQALLVYKLGLALGMPLEWKYYVGELGGVIGSGFLWRQIARQLVGLIPVWGIVPKVAVAYSGTYVVGHAVLQWYLTGRHISNKQLRALSQQAFEQGKEIARGLLDKMPRPKFSLPAPRLPQLPVGKFKPSNNKSKELGCSTCGAQNDPDANFCKNCGNSMPANQK